jgi:hypothetical protein
MKSDWLFISQLIIVMTSIHNFFSHLSSVLFISHPELLLCNKGFWGFGEQFVTFMRVTLVSLRIIMDFLLALVAAINGIKVLIGKADVIKGSSI